MMSDDPRSLRDEVLAANEAVGALAPGGSGNDPSALPPGDAGLTIKEPKAPDPGSIDEKAEARAFGLDNYGEAELIKALFRGRYLRDNSASPPSPAKVFEDVFLWDGAYWRLDQDHQFNSELLVIGQVFQRRAFLFYEAAMVEACLPAAVEVIDSRGGRAPLRGNDGGESGNDGGESAGNNQDGLKPGDAGLTIEAPAAPAKPPPPVEPSGFTLSLIKAKAKSRDATEELVRLVKSGDERLARAHKCWTPARMRESAALACSGPGSLGFSGRWNSDPYLLPCPNGTVDLRTGELLAPRPEHYFNRMAAHPYIPGAPCPTWLDLLDKCLGHDPELLAYFELALGTCLLGVAPKNLFVAWGPSASNGKSTVFGALARVLGGEEGFAAELGPDMFLSQPKRGSDAPRPGLLRLEGPRVAILSEADARDFFDLGQVKKLTGGDVIAERTLNQARYRRFLPSATFFLHTNHIPRSGGYDQGFADRMVVLPFFSRFVISPEVEADPGARIFLARPRAELDAALNREGPGILAWLVAAAGRAAALGCVLPPAPPCSTRYGADYLFDQDLPGRFIEAKCATGPGRRAYSRILYRAFKTWCVEEEGMEPRKIPSETAFGRSLHARFRDRRRDKGGWEYMGVELAPEALQFSGGGPASPDTFDWGSK